MVYIVCHKHRATPLILCQDCQWQRPSKKPPLPAMLDPTRSNNYIVPTISGGRL